MKRKKTKKALSGSILALVLCFVMLIGTTFAWFTSSDSTAVNTIQAGTLKVELEMWDGSNWVDAEGKKLNFTNKSGSADILWEPGAEFTLPAVHIKNNGTLALKYQVVVTAVNGDTKLAEVLDVTFKDGDKTQSCGTLASLLSSDSGIVATDRPLGVGGTTNDLVISMKMQEGAGNAYQGLSIDGIAITVMATQDTVEYDSTTNQYDKDAKYAEFVADQESFSEAIAASVSSGSETLVNLALADGSYTTNFTVAGGKDVEISGNGEDTVLSGQIATTTNTAGTLTLRNLTIKVDNSISDATGISQTGKSAIAIWGNQTVICENVTFDMSLSDSTAITSYWGTNEGTTIIVRNCTFNCNGQRPIRATGNVTVENCTFNDPYRYAVQLTAKDDTATLMDKAVINFHNNTIVDGEHGKDFVYGVQLEGETYGCHACVINGSGNTIESDNKSDCAMYYCECGKVDHNSITWNVEVTPVHAGS